MRFQKVFLYCIGSHTDVLDAQSMTSMLIKLRISTNPRHALEFFKTLDPYCKGYVTFNEFREYIESDD
jgi:Ca2+-binding EF-hand superfamily protein